MFTIRCPKCNRRLFDVVDGEFTTGIIIRCTRCKSMVCLNMPSYHKLPDNV